MPPQPVYRKQVQGTMPEPGDKTIIECPNCGNAFAGIYTEEEELVALGGPECHTCGQQEFDEIVVGDKLA